MLVSINWLSEFCKLPDKKTLVNDLNRIGFEVESCTEKGNDITGIVIGQINELNNHPDADRLKIAAVDIGNEIIQIVTAADNVKKGDKIPVSLPGAVLFGGMKIKKGKLRGVESNGMMCSAVECGLTDTSPGVWVLPKNTPVGNDFVEVAKLKDTILDIAILPNRGDALSYFGLSRECQALYEQVSSFKPKEINTPSKKSDITCQIDPSFCSYYRAQKITGITNQDTPIEYQTRLYYTGFRPVSWIVDVTNIAMCETGQPMHAFEADGVSTITATFGNGESTQLLNEKTYKLTNEIPIINVNNHPAAVAGVMGAKEHEVQCHTSDIILETAQFDSSVIRKTTKQLGVRSESSNRFEKHVDSSALTLGVARVHELLSMHDNISVYKPVESGELEQKSSVIDIDIEKINQLLGTSYTLKDIHRQLSRLGFRCTESQINVPSWRFNDCKEWPDIAEEMCRFSGIETIKSKKISEAMVINHDPKWTTIKKVQFEAVQLGLTEVIPFPLLEKTNNSQPVILNPISSELSQLQQSGEKSLLAIAGFNASRHQRPCRLFSIGPVWESLYNEKMHFSALIQGQQHYQPYQPDQSNSIGFFDIKGIVDQLLNGVQYHLERSKSSLLHPGQSADIIINGQRQGCFGLAHPTIEDAYRIGKTGLIELNVTALDHSKTTHYELISKYPSTTRDVTYIMNQDVFVGDVLQILLKHKPKECTSIALCGYYKKDQSEDVNVSFRMIYQDANRSLEMSEINHIHKTFAEEVIQKLPCRFP